MSLAVMFSPEIEALVRVRPDALDALMTLARIHEQDGVLPPPWIKINDNTWYEDQAYAYMVRTEHRPVLLLTNRCSICSLVHIDVSHSYIFMSPQEFDARIYARYASPRNLEVIEAGTKGGLDNGGTLLTRQAATEKVANGNG